MDLSEVVKNYNKQLLEAAQSGNVAGVRDALDHGAAIETKGDYNDTALNYAAQQGYLEIVKLLVERGADINNKGGGDKTPLMCAAFNSSTAEHNKIVEYLIEKRALISDSLLSGVQLKVNILEENAESGMVLPEGVKAWKNFLSYLGTARVRQDFPNIIPKIKKSLSDPEVEMRRNTADAILAAIINFEDMDISPVVSEFQQLLSDADKEIRHYASAVLCMHFIIKKDVKKVEELFKNKDKDVRQRAAYAIIQLGQLGRDISCAVKLLEKLVSDEDPDVKRMAAEALTIANSKENL